MRAVNELIEYFGNQLGSRNDNSFFDQRAANGGSAMVERGAHTSRCRDGHRWRRFQATLFVDYRVEMHAGDGRQAYPPAATRSR